MQHLANKGCHGDKNRSTFAIFGGGGHEGRGDGDNSQSIVCLVVCLYANSVMANYKRQLEQTHRIKTERRKKTKHKQ